jgi:hypothetical protein
METTTKNLESLRYVARNPYSWPGGYDVIALTSDGALLCSDCVRENYAACYDSTKNGHYDGWGVVGVVDGAWCESGECCDHCNKNLDAYKGEE